MEKGIPVQQSFQILEKIFILIPWFHPAYKAGGPIQSIAGMITHLAEEPLEFSIICSNKDLDGTMLEGVPHDQWVQYSTNARVWYCRNRKAVPVLKTAMADSKGGLLYIVGLYDWEYNFKPLLSTGGIRKIISVRGMLHPGALLQKTLKKRIYFTLWKLLGWQKKHLFHVTDETEGEYVRKVFGRDARIAVAGNFPSLHKSLPMPAKNQGQLKLASVALIGPMKNHLKVLDALRMANGRIEYRIYGPVIDEGYWKQCQRMIEQLPANVSVTYCGAVAPIEIEKILSEHHVFILPSKSENYGHSIIEALSAGRPVITSRGTPWNRLEEASAGLNVDPVIDELSKAIDRFTRMEQDEMDEWGRGAGAYAANALNVEVVKGQYREMFKGQVVEKLVS